MKKVILSLVLLITICFQVLGQLTVADDNKVGIGVTEPDSKFAVGSAGNSLTTGYFYDNATSSAARAGEFYKSNGGGTWGFGVVSSIALSGCSMLAGGYLLAYNGTPMTSKRTYGIKALAGNATSGYNYGVYGYLFGSNNGAAVFGATPGKLDCNTGGVYAGYFRGNVYVENTLYYTTLTQNSDINLKKDIRLLKEEETSQMDKLNTLDGIKYKLKNPADLNKIDPLVADTIKIDPRTLEYDEPKFTDDMIGLSAQEVQKVYPELVTIDDDGYLSMNYIGLIPVLVEALKEQDAAIQDLESTVVFHAKALALLRDEIELLKNPESTTEIIPQ